MDRIPLLGGLMAGLLIGACTSTAPSPSASPATGPTDRATSLGLSAPPGPSSPAAPSASPPTRSAAPAATIPQPVVTDLPVAPESERVDLRMPDFSDPTSITNPLFPVSSQQSVLLLGEVDGKPFRTEVTLLPDPRIIDWAGQHVPTLVSQYVAFLGGEIHEVAYDYYAQADDGSVWYFGEDVFNFAGGSIVDTHGTWIAGIDGPAAMIMPADPQVGDVYRPENIPGFVFEEVTVRSVGQAVDGPLGPVEGAVVVEELHMDGNTEDKTFAPGYGEFYTAGGGDVEALALAVPTDAATGSVPEELTTIQDGAMRLFDAAGAEDWTSASTAFDEMAAAWDAHRATGVPALVEPVMRDTLASLAGAVEGQDAARARAIALDASRSSLDLQLRYRPVAEVDMARFDRWAAELQLDAAAEDLAAVNADHFALDYTRDRILHALAPADATAINTILEELSTAIGDEDPEAVAEAAGRLRIALAGIRIMAP